MIETECFEDINAYEMDSALTPDVDMSKHTPRPKKGFFHRLFRGMVGGLPVHFVGNKIQSNS